jgi:hypothetical protein
VAIRTSPRPFPFPAWCPWRKRAQRIPRHIRRRALVELTSDGVSTAAISEELGCSQRWVQRIVKAAGLARHVKPVHPDLDKDLENIVCDEACRHGDNYGVSMLLLVGGLVLRGFGLCGSCVCPVCVPAPPGVFLPVLQHCYCPLRIPCVEKSSNGRLRTAALMRARPVGRAHMTTLAGGQQAGRR